MNIVSANFQLSVSANFQPSMSAKFSVPFLDAQNPLIYISERNKILYLKFRKDWSGVASAADRAM